METGEENNTELVTLTEEQENDTMKISVLSLSILIFICVVVFLAVGFILIYGLQRNHYIFKNNSCNRPITLVASSTTKFHRVLNRVGRSLNEHHRNYDDQHLSPPSRSSKGQVPKCQKVLIATSGKNGMVENKSICSTKISSRSSSLTFSNCTTEEDVSPKRVLLN